jgi:hypothetical protein
MAVESILSYPWQSRFGLVDVIVKSGSKSKEPEAARLHAPRIPVGPVQRLEALSTAYVGQLRKVWQKKKVSRFLEGSQTRTEDYYI